MALPTLKKPESAAAAQKFISGGVKTISAPRAKARKYADEEQETYLKILFFGPIGSGKSWVTKGLLELGFKVLVVTTDIGGNGLNSIITPMRRAGTWDAVKNNLREISLNGYEEIKSFFKEPETFEGLEDLYDWDPDFIFWDGISSWQSVDISEYIGDMVPDQKSGVSDAREAGLQFSIQDWGQVTSATVRGMDDFCSMRNKKTGRLWNKIGTCHELIRPRGQGAGGGFVDAKEPLLQGRGGKLVLGAFDIVARTYLKVDTLDTTKRSFVYQFQSDQNLVAKVRGFDLPPETEADPKKLFKDLYEQLGMTLPNATLGTN